MNNGIRNMDTYNAYLTVQYYLKSHNTDALSLLSRKDPVSDAVDTELCMNMKNAHILNTIDEKERADKKRPNLETKKANRDKMIKKMEEEEAARLESIKRKRKNAYLSKWAKTKKKKTN